MAPVPGMHGLSCYMREKARSSRQHRRPAFTLRSTREHRRSILLGRPGHTCLWTTRASLATTAPVRLRYAGPVVFIGGGFATQPTNQTVVLGATATFDVRAFAYPSPSYQWYFNGVSIPAGTSSSLQISNAQMTNAGTYWVVLFNPAWGPPSGGYFTSSSATLTVLAAAPNITSPPLSQTAETGS